MKKIATYKIIYSNGFIQYKNLISHDDYVNIIKSIRNKIFKLETEKSDFSKKEIQKKLSILKGKIDNLFGKSWFTDKSPLFYAIESGKLELLESQGGSHDIKLVKT